MVRGSHVLSTTDDGPINGLLVPRAANISDLGCSQSL
jgi:hypothetical protein